MSQIDKSQLMKEVYAILVDADLNTLTRKMIQTELEQKHGCSFAERKAEIKEAIEQYLTVMEVVSSSQKSKEEKIDNSSQKPEEQVEKLFEDSSESDPVDENDLTYDGYKADSELSKIVGDTIQLRKSMSKKVWKYVYDHNLLDDKMINCDSFLESLCGKKTIKTTEVYHIVTSHSSKEGKVTFKKRQSKKANKEKPKKEKATKEKPAKKAKKTVEAKEASSKPRGGVGMEYPVDQALSEFVGSSVCSRGTYTKKVWEYIKEHNLQNPENRREIICDEKLKSILLKDRLDMMHIAKQFAEHMIQK